MAPLLPHIKAINALRHYRRHNILELGLKFRWDRAYSELFNHSSLVAVEIPIEFYQSIKNVKQLHTTVQGNPDNAAAITQGQDSAAPLLRHERSAKQIYEFCLVLRLNCPPGVRSARENIQLDGHVGRFLGT